MQIAQDDFLMFINRALYGMLDIIEEMGDELANQKPNIPGGNSPYVILYHCVEMTNYWIGTLLGGRENTRDRDAEFVAKGKAADLRQAVQQLKSQIVQDLRDFQGEKLLESKPLGSYTPMPGYTDWTQGAVLVHTYEELAQHHGQMEVTRDILMQNNRS